MISYNDKCMVLDLLVPCFCCVKFELNGCDNDMNSKGNNFNHKLYSLYKLYGK